MTDLTVEDYLLVPYDQIDYGSLASSMLLQLAVQNMEPFMATMALGQLAIRRAPEVRTAALQILGAPWDRYLSASAVECLFGADMESGMVAMERLLPDCCDPVILASMIDNVMSESELFTQPDYVGFACALARRVRAIDPAEFSDRDERDEFVAMFAAPSR